MKNSASPNFKILMTTAGIGGRSEAIAQGLNKTLINLGDLPTFVRVISQFPETIPVVVVLGYQGQMVRDAISQTFPNRDISYVTVDVYEGDGSGLGRSILAAKDHLQCPFVFTPNDCFVDEVVHEINPNISGNWVLAVKADAVDETILHEYRGLSKCGDFLDQILIKGYQSEWIYTGLCGIKSYETFWKYMESCDDPTIGEVYAVRELDDVRVYDTIDWYDVGNVVACAKAKDQFSSSSQYNVLPKPKESIWFHGGKVHKLFADPQLVEKRLKRCEFIALDLLPNIISAAPTVYTYESFDGVVLSKIQNESVSTAILDTMQKAMWGKRSSLDKETIGQMIKSFYLDKTLERINAFILAREYLDRQSLINGKLVPSAAELIGSIDINQLIEKSRFSLFHGDFHNENILYNSEEATFCLLDWRHEFAGSLEWGDVYYDLAKFLHGLIVAHSAVKAQNFSIKTSSTGYELDIHQSLHQQRVKDTFFQWCQNNSYDTGHVTLITALIFLNIAPLHHQPYDMFLFQLGRLMLSDIFETQNLE